MKSYLLKLKDSLFSERGMRIVNTLFFLSACFRGWLSFIALLAWMAYLVYCLTHTDSKVTKIVFSLLLLFAAVLFGFNAYGFFK